MLSRCVYESNNKTYNKNSFTILDLKYTNIKNFLFPNGDYTLSTNEIYNLNIDFIVLDKTINEFMSEINKNTLYNIIYCGEKINFTTSHENVIILHIDQVLSNKEILQNKVSIVESNFKDIIGQTFAISEKIAIFSLENPSINNFISYKYSNSNIVCKTTLSYVVNDVSSQSISYQLLALYNYKQFNNSKKLLTQLIRTCNLYMNVSKNKTNCKTIISEIDVNQIYHECINESVDETNLSDIVYINHTNISNSKIQNYFHLLQKIKNNIDKVKRRKQSFDSTNSKEISDQNILDFYTSFLSYENCLDCVSNNDCLGIVINVKNNPVFSLSKIKLINRTSLLITLTDLLNSVVHYTSTYNLIDDGSHIYSSISGGCLGKGNGMLPLYINDEHWKVAKNNIEECLSLSLSQISYCFEESMYCVYHIVLSEMINNMFETISYKDFVIFLDVWETIQHLQNDKKYKNEKEHHMFNTEHAYKIKDCKVSLIDCLIFDNIDASKCFYAYWESLRRSVYKFDAKKRDLFKNYRLNRSKIWSFMYNDYENIYNFSRLKKEINNLLLEKRENMISEESYKSFIKKLEDVKNNKEHFLSFDHKETVLDNIILQSFLTKNNKKYEESFHTKRFTNFENFEKTISNNVTMENIISCKSVTRGRFGECLQKAYVT